MTTECGLTRFSCFHMAIREESESVSTDLKLQETQRTQYEGHNTPQGYYTDQGPYRTAVSMVTKGCIVPEVFLMFTNQLYSCLCKYNAKVFHILTRGKYCKRNTPSP